MQLRVAGRRCVVVGAGRVGARRASQLVEAGAEVVVVAPAAGERVADLARAGRLVHHPRAFLPGDAAGAFLVVVATGDPAADDGAAVAAGDAGALVERADRAAEGDVAVSGVVRRGPLSVAVSTGGLAPAVSAWATGLLDAGLDGLLGLDADGVALLVDVVAEVRSELAAGRGSGPGVTPARPDWRSALDRTMLDLIDSGRRAQAKERLLACLSSS